MALLTTSGRLSTLGFDTGDRGTSDYDQSALNASSGDPCTPSNLMEDPKEISFIETIHVDVYVEEIKMDTFSNIHLIH